MPTDISSERLGRRGIGAVFTDPYRWRGTRFLIGILGILAGIILWIAVILQLRFPSLFGEAETGLAFFVLFNSIGLVLVINGVGICLTFSVTNSTTRTVLPSDKSASSMTQDRRLYDEGSLRSLRDSADPHSDAFFTRNTKFGVIAFLQSCLVLGLYSGLTDEYTSNKSMQLWIHSNFPAGQLLLNWWTGLIIGGVLGLLVVQFLPHGLFAEKG